MIVRGIINRSKKNDIFCDLTAEDVRAALSDQDGRCFYTGLPFGEIGDRSAPSVDRIDPARGYTKDNIVICHRVVNTMKLDQPIGDFLLKAILIASNTDAIRNDPKIRPHIGPAAPAVDGRDWDRAATEIAIATEIAVVARLAEVRRDLAASLIERHRLTKDLISGKSANKALHFELKNIQDKLKETMSDLDAAHIKIAALEADNNTMNADTKNLRCQSDPYSLVGSKKPPLLLKLCASPDTIVEIMRG